MLKRVPFALACAVCALGLVIARPATAAPDTADRVAHFLAERGLVEAPATSVGGSAEPGLGQRLRGGASAAGDWASDLVISAMNFLGVHYRRGGDSVAGGFDCSGFTRHVFESSIGLVLPRRSQEQARSSALQPIERSDLRPGDLVFFNTLRAAFSHVGIYIGDGKFIHSPRSGSTVRVEDMRLAYWQKRYDGARRVAPPADAAVVALPAARAASASAP
ncbi:MAG TPA: C40 family peptidase [Methylibium sp.]|nr:C40 family peptidase [Methylibium sp.]